MNFLHRTWAEIDLSALENNFKKIKAAANGAMIFSVVKANAYGHSYKEIVPILDRLGSDAFAVSNIVEALEIRELGINKPILILGYTPETEAKTLSDNDIIQAVYSREYATQLSYNAQKENVTVKAYLKLDTGMGRIGFDCRDDNLNGISDALFCSKIRGLEVTGAFTHFAESDRSPEADDGFTDSQYIRFINATDYLKKNGAKLSILHACNSAGIINDEDKHLNAIRPGIILYGLKPDKGMNLNRKLIPVMTLKSTVSMVKTIKCGDTVNYGRTFKAEKEMKIATVSAGYADGYPRALSNKGYVIIGGKRCNIVGRICMDQFCADVTDNPTVKMGDEVVLFGKELPADSIAEMCDTINYEIVCGVSARVPRIIKE